LKVIGISGISGSGKSRLTNSLAKHYGGRILVIHQDNFYHDQSDKIFEKRITTNYDEPDAIEFSLFTSKVKEIINGKETEIPIYDFAKHTRSEKKVVVKPTDILLLEGTMIFTQKDLTDLMDIKVFVHTPMDIAIVRRITRDIEERDRTASDIRDQYFKTVRKGMYQYSISYKGEADFIVSGEKDVLDYKDFVCSIIEM
jgi:uridine kinase